MLEKIVKKNQSKLFDIVMKNYYRSFMAFTKRKARELRRNRSLEVPTFYDEFRFVVDGCLPEELSELFEARGFTVSVNFDENVRGKTVISRRYYPC